MLLTEEGRWATMGDEFILHHSAELKVSVPYRARIRLIRNGNLYHQATGEELSVKLSEPGVYRIEAYLKIFGRVSSLDLFQSDLCHSAA